MAPHHTRSHEVWVGFYRRESGKPSITWPEAVAEALCYGWIDGVRKRIDGHKYTIRFTPRQPGSTWSAVNVKRVKDLIRRGRMRAAGTRAYLARTQEKTGIYSFEQQRAPTLPPALERRLKARAPAWRFFQTRAAWYRRAAIWWIISAKREDTQRRRLSMLIEHSAHARTIPPLTRKR